MAKISRSPLFRQLSKIGGVFGLLAFASRPVDSQSIRRRKRTPHFRNKSRKFSRERGTLAGSFGKNQELFLDSIVECRRHAVPQLYGSDRFALLNPGCFMLARTHG
jgi:hypothetical protein